MSSVLGGVSASLGELKVFLTADTAKLASQLKNATERMEKFRNASAKVALAAGAAFAGMAIGINKVIGVLKVQEDAERKLAVAVKATGQAIDVDKVKQYASALQNVTTFGDELTIEAAALISTFGVTEDQLLKLLPVVQDVATMYGRSLPEAAKTMGRALAQGAGSLTEFGVALSKSQIEAFNLGDKSERVTKMIEIFAGVAGGAATEAAKTAGGGLAQFNNAMGDTIEALGKLLSVSLAPFLRSMTRAFTFVNDVLAKLRPGIAKFLSFFAVGGVAMTGAVAGIAALSTAFSGLSVAALKVIPVILPIAPLLLAIAAATVGVISGIGAMRMAWDANLFGMRDAIEELKKAFTFDFVIDRAVDLIEFFTKKLVGSAMLIKNTFLSVQSGITGEGFFNPVVKAFEDTEAAYEKLRNTLKEDVTPAIGKATGQFATGFARPLKAIGSAIVSDFNNFKTAFGKGLETILDGVVAVVTTDSDEVAASAKKTSVALDAVTASAETLEQTVPKTFGEVLAGSISDLLGGLGVAGQRLSDASIAAADMITGAISQHAPALAGAMEAAVKGFAAGGPIGALISVILSLLTRTKAFADILKSFEGIIVGLLDIISAALEPIADAIQLFSFAVGKVLKIISGAIRFINKWLGAGIISNILGKVIPGEVERIAGSLTEAGNILADSVEGLSRIFGRETQQFVTQAPTENLVTMMGVAGPELQEAIRKELEARLEAATMSQQVAEAQAVIAEQVAAEQLAALEALGEGANEAALMGHALAAAFSAQTAQRLRDEADSFEDAIFELGTALEELDIQTGSLAENMERANEELTNVPTGFKIALSRFRAIEGEAITAPAIGFGAKPDTALGSALAPAEGRGGFNIENMVIENINADNAKEWLDSIEEETKWVDTVVGGTKPISADAARSALSRVP
jgi:hypothetical protein